MESSNIFVERSVLENMNLEQVEDTNITKVKDDLKQLYNIWHKLGIDEQQKKLRLNSAFRHIHDLISEMVKEEESYYKVVVERIKNYQAKIAELTAVLAESKTEEAEGTILMQEKALRLELDKLIKLKYQRKKQFDDLSSVEKKYCDILGIPQLQPSSSTGVLTEKYLHELKQHVNMLSEKINDRRKKLFHLKKELSTILEITEITPETSLEKEVLSSEEFLSLSDDRLKVLEEIVNKTKSKMIDIENKKKILLDKLNVLWQRLNIDEDDKKKFLEKCNDYRLSTLKAIEEEIHKCEEKKKQNIKKYIDALKEELSALWAKCFTSEEDKKKFLEKYADNISEDVLDIYDNEVNKLRKYYSSIEHIVSKIIKRNELMDLITVLEKKAADPNRFKNRKGNLLKEERERKKIQKDLPALENEIFKDIEKYEEEFGQSFLYFGEDFRQFAAKQWDERNAQKEIEKLAKQKLRSQQLESEITLGTTPCKRPLAHTPKSAPSKLFKSSIGVPVYRTPVMQQFKQMPSTLSKLKTTVKLTVQRAGAKNVDKHVLKEKNKISEASGSLDSTTYTDFADKLNRSSRNGHRSSVLTSKKIVGTRITQNNSLRKSAGKSRKSFKKSSTSKVTPVRGKPGLPIII